MKKVALLFAVIVMCAMGAKLNAQTNPEAVKSLGLESVEIMPAPGIADENGQIIDNNLEVILIVSNPELGGRAIINVKMKGNDKEILQAVDVKMFLKDGVPYYAVGKRERAFKRGAALISVPLGTTPQEQVSVEVVLYNNAGVQVDNQVK